MASGQIDSGQDQVHHAWQPGPPAAQHIEPGLAGQPPDQGCAGQHAGGEAAAAGCEVAGGSGPELTEPFDLVVLAGSWSVVRQLRSMPEPWYNVPNDR